MGFQNDIRNYIIDQFLFGDGSELQDDTSFLEQSIIDSTGVMELVTFLEETFSIKIKDDEILPENLDSVEKINAFVQKKIGSNN